MKRSESIGFLAKALAKAQGEIKAAVKDAANPSFHSKYSTLASIIEVIQQPFAGNGIAWTQLPRFTETGVEVETIFFVQTEKGDEFISEILAVPVAKQDAQGVGSAISYAKRYCLQAMAGVPSEDDDGNAASHPVQKDQKTAVRSRALAILKAAVPNGIASLELAWKTTLSEEQRTACLKDLASLKDEASAFTPSA